MNPKRVLILLLVIGLFAGAAYGANYAQVQRNAAKMLRQARTAVERQSSAEALQLYESYLNFQPKDVEALGELATLLEGNTNPKAKRTMMDSYERMMIVAPNRQDDRRKLIKLYLDHGMYTNAKHHLVQYLDIANGITDDTEVLEQLANCEFRIGKPTDGIDILKRLIATRKARPEVYSRLAEMLRRDAVNKDSTAADQVMAQLQRDHEKNIDARVIAINDLYRRGEVAKAREATRQAAVDATDHDKNPDFVLMLVDLFMHEKQYPQARDILQKAIDRNPNDARLRAVSYQVHGKLNDQTKSAADLKKALELAKVNDLTTVDLIDVVIQRGQLDLAREEIAKRYGTQEQFRPILDYLNGRLAYAEGNWSEALPKFQSVLAYLERFPIQYATAQINIAECQIQANQLERAYEAYSKALLARPNHNVARLGRADVLLRLNRVAEAEPTLREYAETFPFARLAWANAKLNEQLNRPVNRRSWSEFEVALGKPPYPVELELLRVQAYLGQDKTAEAEKLLKNLMKVAPESADVRIANAQFLLPKDPQGATRVLDEADSFLGDNVALRTARVSLIARTTRDTKRIQEIANKAGNLKPEEKRLLNTHVALTLASLGDYPPAIALLKPIAEQLKFDLPTRTYLAEWYLRTKQYTEAESVVAEMKKLDGEHGSTAAFVHVLLELNRTPKLTREIAKPLQEQLLLVAKKRETWARPYSILGAIATSLDDPDAAYRHFRRAHELGERDSESLGQYVNSMLNRGRNEEARRVLEDRRRVAPLPDNLQRTLSLLEAAQGIGGNASADIIRKTENSTDPKEQLFRARWFLLNNSKPEAIQAFNKATELAPHLPDAWLGLVQAHWVNGDAKAAKETTQKAAAALAAAREKLESPSLIPQTIGQCYEIMGDAASAEQTYLKALESSANDAIVTPALADLYRRMGRVNDATTRCEAILKSDAAESLKRWARRTLSANKMIVANRVAALKDAVALIDENLKSGDHAEDLRAKAFLIAEDPFRRAEAHELLETAALREPMPPSDLYRLAKLFVQEDRLQKAESTLQEASRSPMAPLEVLVLLNQVQVQTNRLDLARNTVRRLAQAAPQSWAAISEEARLIAKQGDKKKAAAMVKEFPNGDKPEVQLQVLAPHLAALGCLEDAEEMYVAVAKKSKLPNRHVALAYFYVENQMPLKAMKAAWEPDRSEFPPQLPKVTLVKNAVASRPRASIPAADLPEWDRIVAELLVALDDELKVSPTNLAMLTAKAAVLDSIGKYEDAIRAYEAVLAIDEKQFVALNNLAILLALHVKDSSERPLKFVNQAMELAGPRGYLLDSRATILLAQGKHEAAMKDLLAARSTEPRGVYDFHLAQAAEQAKNADLKRQYQTSAREKGLRKTSLHPLEWPIYERLYGAE